MAAGFALFLSGGETIVAGSSFAPSDIEELATISDLVVQGEIIGVAQRHREGPGEGSPLVVYEFAVADSFGGEVGGTIFLSYIDTSEVRAEDIPLLRQGRQLVLFLNAVDTTHIPEVAKFEGNLYTPWTPHGVFSVDGGTLTSAGNSGQQTAQEVRRIVAEVFAERGDRPAKSLAEFVNELTPQG